MSLGGTARADLGLTDRVQRVRVQGFLPTLYTVVQGVRNPGIVTQYWDSSGGNILDSRLPAHGSYWACGGLPGVNTLCFACIRNAERRHETLSRQQDCRVTTRLRPRGMWHRAWLRPRDPRPEAKRHVALVLAEAEGRAPRDQISKGQRKLAFA